MLMRPVVQSITARLLEILPRPAAFAAVFGLVLLLADQAFASSDLQGYAATVSTKTNVMVDIFSYVVFIIGCVYAGLGISELRKHVEGKDNIPLRHPITKLVVGGMFLGLPWITYMVFDTMASFGPFELIQMTAYSFKGTGGNNVQGGQLSELIAKGMGNASVLVNVASFVGFIIAVFFTVRGIQMVKAHIDNPGNAPMAEGLKRLGVAGALYSLPMITDVVYQTFGAQNRALGNSGWSSNGGTAGGLDGMMVNFISDISNVSYFAIEVFCYIAGILMIFFALQRLVRTSQDGPRGPLGFGTIVMFVVAGLLISFPQFLNALDMSIFGRGSAATNVQFLSLAKAGVDAAQIQNAKNVFSAVLAFMAIIGFLSVVRGLFLLKAFADGNNQATMMSVVTHIVAGALAINLGSFINAVQKTLGVTDIPVTFS